MQQPVDENQSAPENVTFNASAVAYDLLLNEPKRWAREQAFHELWLERAGGERRVLDVGCGTGFHSRHFALHLNADVTGIDPSTPMLDVARGKPGADLVHWIEASTANLPAGPFDVVLLLGNTLCLIDEVEPVLHAVHVVMRTGGIFIVQILDYDRLRADGMHTRVTDRADDRYRITKTLTPIAGAESEFGAQIEMIVRDADDNALSRRVTRLREHNQTTWLPTAQRIGLSLLELRSEYDLEAKQPGPDRIFIFQKN